jgi:hypothetical protein
MSNLSNFIIDMSYFWSSIVLLFMSFVSIKHSFLLGFSLFLISFGCFCVGASMVYFYIETFYDGLIEDLKKEVIRK